MLCRHEFNAKRDSNLPEIQNALIHLKRLEAQWKADSPSD
jgi:hypothetical protein